MQDFSHEIEIKSCGVLVWHAGQRRTPKKGSSLEDTRTPFSNLQKKPELNGIIWILDFCVAIVGHCPKCTKSFETNAILTSPESPGNFYEYPVKERVVQKNDRPLQLVQKWSGTNLKRLECMQRIDYN